ncbi:MAG TPA: hypothetical protein VK972_04070 [Wenzhouxiangella sp.]|nr:hypothetical protein [Wenzhouxiangella sp.]
MFSVSISGWLGSITFPALAAPPFANPGEGAGSIVGTPAQPARDIYPVKVVAIDGEQIIPREVFWLEPGKYTLTVSALITNPPGLSAMRGRMYEDDDINKIDVVVEAGKTYYIGAHFTGKDRRAPYNTVVYRVEDSK